MRRMPAASLALTFMCFLLMSCQRAKEPEDNKNVQIQKEEITHQGVADKDTQKGAEGINEAKVTEQEPRPPLDRAKGKEVILQDGKPMITWGGLKDLPALDEILPALEKIPDGVEFPDLTPPEDEKYEKIIQLPETEERKKLKKKVWDEYNDGLWTAQSRDGKCVIELYSSTPPKGKKENWLRGIDPETHEVLWKYDEPGSFIMMEEEFAKKSDFFILMGLFYTRESRVKLFSCRQGFLKEIYSAKGDFPPHRMAKIAPDEKSILVRNNMGKILDIDLSGRILWEKQVDPYYGAHVSSLYFIRWFISCNKLSWSEIYSL